MLQQVGHRTCQREPYLQPSVELLLDSPDPCHALADIPDSHRSHSGGPDSSLQGMPVQRGVAMYARGPTPGQHRQNEPVLSHGRQHGSSRTASRQSQAGKRGAKPTLHATAQQDRGWVRHHALCIAARLRADASATEANAHRGEASGRRCQHKDRAAQPVSAELCTAEPWGTGGRPTPTCVIPWRSAQLVRGCATQPGRTAQGQQHTY